MVISPNKDEMTKNGYWPDGDLKKIIGLKTLSTITYNLAREQLSFKERLANWPRIKQANLRGKVWWERGRWDHLHRRMTAERGGLGEDRAKVAALEAQRLSSSSFTCSSLTCLLTAALLWHLTANGSSWTLHDTTPLDENGLYLHHHRETVSPPRKRSPCTLIRSSGWTEMFHLLLKTRSMAFRSGDAQSYNTARMLQPQEDRVEGWNQCDGSDTRLKGTVVQRETRGEAPFDVSKGLVMFFSLLLLTFVQAQFVLTDMTSSRRRSCSTK